MTAPRTLLGVRLDDLALEEVLARIRAALQTSEGTPLRIVTVNPEFLLGARKDAEFAAALQDADLAVADGVGLQYAARALWGEQLKHRVRGGDLLPGIVSACAAQGTLLAIVGGHQEELARVGAELRRAHPSLQLETLDPGFVDDALPRLSEHTVAVLRRLAPRVIILALGQGRGKRQGKQEKVLQMLAHDLPGTRVIVGVGGAIDVLANPHLRAPESWRRRGLEWLWRLLRQPWRAPRIARALIIFPLIVAFEAWRQGRLLSAIRSIIKKI